MATKWCPSCRSEWWTDAGQCRDCGSVLVDDEPPEPDDDERAVEAERRHGLAELDLPDVDRAGRWRLTLALEANGFAHQWRGSTLLLPAAAVELIEDELAELESSDRALDGQVEVGLPVEEDMHPSGPPRLRRFMGFLVDSFFYSVVWFIAVSIWQTTEFVGERNGFHVYRHAMPYAVRAGMSVLVLGVAIVTVGQWGRTPGMAVAGIEVLDANGGRLSWPRSTVRTLLADGWALLVFVPTSELPDLAAAAVSVVASVIWPLALFGPILASGGLGLHDRAVGSVVRRRG